MVRDPNAPMVLDTRGYGNSYSGLDNELSGLLAANRLNVEHRFFWPSVPDPLGAPPPWRRRPL